MNIEWDIEEGDDLLLYADVGFFEVRVERSHDAKSELAWTWEIKTVEKLEETGGNPLNTLVQTAVIAHGESMLLDQAVSCSVAVAKALGKSKALPGDVVSMIQDFYTKKAEKR